MDIKKTVEHICCEYTHGMLIDLCGFYYKAMKKDPTKAKRHDLEQVAFIILTLNIDPAGIYEAFTEDSVVHECIPAPKVIDFVLKKTLYSWFDEPEFPVLKDTLQRRVYVRKIATKTI